MKMGVTARARYHRSHFIHCYTFPAVLHPYVLHVASHPVFLLEKEQGIQNVPLVQERVKGTLPKTVSLLLSV